MAKPIHRKKNPLLEVVLDIQAGIDPNTPIEIFEKYHLEVKEEFPVKNVSTFFTTSFQIKPGETAKIDTNSQANGFIFKSADGNKIVQFRKNGFSYNLLNSYTDWASFSKEAKIHLTKYLEITRPKLVNRLALRYINVLNLPMPVTDFKDYILTIPDIAPEIPQALTELNMRIVIPDEQHENVAIITEGIDQKRLRKNSTFLPVVFDIDVFRLINIEPNLDIIWDFFKRIKGFQNRIFFNSITEKTVALYNK